MFLLGIMNEFVMIEEGKISFHLINHKNIIKTRLIDKLPYFNISLYQEGELDMILNDYSIFHECVLNGTFEQRYFYVFNPTHVGIGNRIEVLQYGLLFSILSSRAFISEWRIPFDIHIILNITDYHIRWFRFNQSELINEVNGSILLINYPNETISYFDHNISMIDSFGDAKAVILKELSWNEIGLGILPFQYGIYDHPLYKDLIPRLFHNWKHEMIKLLLKTPSEGVQNQINLMKERLQPFDYLISVQIRAGHVWVNVNRTLECTLFFTKNLTLTFNPNLRIKYFLASDNEEHKKTTIQVLGVENVIYNDIIPIGAISYGTLDYFYIYAVFADWWMIGEANLKILTAYSTFGYTASDRTKTKRFIISDNTQCINESIHVTYLKEDYIDPYDSWKLKGKSTFIPYQ